MRTKFYNIVQIIQNIQINKVNKNIYCKSVYHKYTLNS